MAKTNQAATPDKPKSIAALCRMLKVGREALRIALVNVTPAGKSDEGHPLWTESQARAALEAAGSRGTMGPLKDQKLQEQIRQLKLLNDKKEGTLCDKAKVVSAMGAIQSRNLEFWHHMIQILPSLLVGKEMPEIVEELKKQQDNHGQMLAGCAELFRDIK